MNLYRHFFRILLLSLILFRSNLFAAEDRKLDIPVPLNEDVLGIRIPYYNEQGQLDMQFDAKVARKTDENHATLTDLKISLFERDNDTMTISMPKGIFDLQTNILSSNSNVHIQRSDLNIEADSIIFKTKERFAHFNGRVKMTVRNLDLGKPDSKNSAE